MVEQGARKAWRRVVTGLDGEGRSAVFIDGPPASSTSVSGRSGVVWRTDAVPADNSGQEDIAAQQISVSRMGRDGSLFFIHEFPPDRAGEPFWHKTSSIDYVTMMEGEVVFMTEAGDVTLRAGDVLVDRGANHAWRNDSGKPAIASIVIIPAHPIES